VDPAFSFGVSALSPDGTGTLVQPYNKGSRSDGEWGLFDIIYALFLLSGAKIHEEETHKITSQPG